MKIKLKINIIFIMDDKLKKNTIAILKNLMGGSNYMRRDIIVTTEQTSPNSLKFTTNRKDAIFVLEYNADKKKWHLTVTYDYKDGSPIDKIVYYSTDDTFKNLAEYCRRHLDSKNVYWWQNDYVLGCPYD